MNILILDLDWMFEKSDLPSIECKRLSSFHKQRQDKVYLVNDLNELKYQYDYLYVFSNSDSTPILKFDLINDKKTILLGKKFELCGAKTLGKVITSCRPDYTLYAVETNSSYAKANFITFFTQTGDRITHRQNWKNTHPGIKRTIVTDDTLWSRTPDVLVSCFNEIQNEKNIVFLAPISLKYLIDNIDVQDKFCLLHFSSGTKFKWKNDVGSDEESALLITTFLKKLKAHTKSNLGAVPIQAILNIENKYDSIKRLIKTIAVFKLNKIKCFIPIVGQVPQEIKWISRWCDKNFDNSFIEEMIFFDSARKGKRWMHIINNPKEWGSTRIKFLISLLKDPEWRELLPQMSIQVGTNYLDYNCIDFNIIDKNAYALI